MSDDGYDYDIHDIDLDAVELFLIKPATPGPWRDDDVYGLVSPTKIDGFAFPQERAEAKRQIRADAKLAAQSRTLLPALVERVRSLETKNTTLGMERVRLHDALDRVAIFAASLIETGAQVPHEIGDEIIRLITTNPLPSEQDPA